MDMSTKRKNTRMIPRATRQANTVASREAEAALTDAQRDIRTIRTAIGSGATITQPVIAEVWLAVSSEPLPEPYEVELRDALARQYVRETGRGLTLDEAESVMDYDPRDERDYAV